MREIKFRGKSKTSGKWIYGYLGISYDGILQIEIYDKFKNTIELIDSDPETVGQYTGLQDKNGVEIYEGDIVKIKSKFEKEKRFYKVGFYNCGFDLTEIRTDNSDWLNEFGSDELEVVGNIHDNPELLRGEKK